MGADEGGRGAVESGRGVGVDDGGSVEGGVEGGGV
jgi:hypothetical protein